MSEFAGAGNNGDEIGIDDRKVGKYTMSVAVMLTSVEAHRIRRFEQGSLINPLRTESGQRLFSNEGIELIREIATLEDQGINMPGIKAILEMRGESSGAK